MSAKKYCHCGSEMGKGVCLDGASVICKERIEYDPPEPTHPTAEEIAKEAAEVILGNALLPGGEVRMNLNMTMAQQVILTAARRIAAQMVRESGAVEALESDPPEPDMQEASGLALNRYDKAMLTWDEKRKAALAKLRAITTQP